VSQPFDLAFIFNREGWLRQNGISTNNDGSTNNLMDFYTYTRDVFIKRLPYFYLAYQVWGLLSGLILYYLVFRVASGIIVSDGQTNDYYNSGFVVFMTLIVFHHMLMWTETKNFTICEFTIYPITALFFILTINSSNNGPGVDNPYKENQWSMILISPVTYLTSFIGAFIILMPRFIHRTFDEVIFHPEFTKIKA
jgi:hypothetical protein